MTIRTAAAAFLFASLLSMPCQAKEASIGEASVTLTTPSGQCELDPKQPGDARMLQATEGMLAGVGNRLLGFYADCKQLTDWHTGKRPLLEDFSQYQTLQSAANSAAPPNPEEAIKQLCSQQRQEGEKMMSGLAPDLKARVEEAVRGVTVNQTRFLGVVGEEPSVCYAALAQRIKAESGKDVTLVSVFATTFIKGKIVYYYLYSPYRSAQTVTALLARHKLNVAALLQANKKMAQGPGRNYSSVPSRQPPILIGSVQPSVGHPHLLAGRSP
jgi:hypothetical protein